MIKNTMEINNFTDNGQNQNTIKMIPRPHYTTDLKLKDVYPTLSTIQTAADRWRENVFSEHTLDRAEYFIKYITVDYKATEFLSNPNDVQTKISGQYELDWKMFYIDKNYIRHTELIVAINLLTWWNEFLCERLGVKERDKYIRFYHDLYRRAIEDYTEMKYGDDAEKYLKEMIEK